MTHPELSAQQTRQIQVLLNAGKMNAAATLMSKYLTKDIVTTYVTVIDGEVLFTNANGEQVEL